MSPRSDAPESGRIALARVKFHPANELVHPDEQIEVLTAVMGHFGQQRLVLLDADDYCVAGEGVCRAALRLGWKEIEFERSDLSGAMADGYRVADNAHRMRTALDWEITAANLRGIEEAWGGSYDPRWLGMTSAERDALLTGAPPPREDGGAARGKRPGWVVIKVTGVRLADRDDMAQRFQRALQGTGLDARAY
jgi:hypothetical protein